MRVLLCLLALVSGVTTNCVFLHCPAFSFSKNVDCSNCSQCMGAPAKFCSSFRNRTCGCVDAVPAGCQRKATNQLEVTSFCSLHESLSIPAPVVRPRGASALTVTVPRFFSHPPFDTKKPENLMLMVKFHTKTSSHCRDFHSIEAQRRSDTECLMRVKLAMPGIDHKTDDHYYYDDGTELESEFSLEVFESAEILEIWTEVTLTNAQQVADDVVHFYSMAKSPLVRHQLPRREVEHLLNRADNTSDTAHSTNSTTY